MLQSFAVGFRPKARLGTLRRRLAPRRAAACLVLATASMIAGIAAALAADLGYTTQVTPGLLAAYTRQFGSAARARIGSWVDFGRTQKGAPRMARLIDTPGAELTALQTVNSYFNRVPFLPDVTHWGVEDYWATPAELSASNGGDCEDYSIAKYFFLKELGVPVTRLRITYVKAVNINQAHMVLAYYASPEAEPLILDNLEDGVRSASRRPDLVPVYSFNDEDIIIVQTGSKARSQQIRAWRDLLQKLEAEARI